MRALLVGFAVLVVAACAASGAPGDDAGEHLCRCAGTDIVIDGKLDDAAWERAEVITQWYPLAKGFKGELPPSKVRLLWDDENLYIGFDYTDDDIRSYSETPDDELWNGDVAELFIKPDREKPLYYEFVIAPNGTLFDAEYPSRDAGGYKVFRGWSSGARVATEIRGSDGDTSDDDKGYTVEVAIPLSIFPDWAQPAADKTWTFGAFRYDYSKSYEEPITMMVIPEAVGHGFHSHEYYATLRFVK